jgi:cytochrome c nitrite reductase small subunit
MDGGRPAAAPGRVFETVRFTAAAAVGIAVGVGLWTFVYAEGGSYMTDDPAACANCHVMQPYLDAWRKSSHHGVAVCNDCHTPADVVGKYTVKATNGWHHSRAFTTGDFPETLRIRRSNHEVVEARCRGCHGELTASLEGHGEGETCTRCHASVGHMR